MKTKSGLGRQIYRGEGVVPGIAIGQSVVFATNLITFPKYWIHGGEVKSQIGRFHKAIQNCKLELDQIKSKLCRIQGREQISILDSHILLIQDELLIRNIVHRIEQEFINAEWAVDRTLSEIKHAFAKINQAYFRERRYDVDYIENVIQRSLMGKSQEFFPRVSPGSIVIAYDLSPAEILHLIRYRIVGLATEVGGLNSHTAIVVRSLEIPSIIGVEGLIEHVAQGDSLVLDSQRGILIRNPSEGELRRFRRGRQRRIESQKDIRRQAQLEARTQDGHDVRIMANIELLDELELIKESGAQGVGLYRTEFLFFDRETAPSFEEQIRTYRKVLQHVHPHEVIFRTVDLGADKLSPACAYADQPNPALGLRAIRFCMREKEIFATQLRALLATSRYGSLKISFPMISSVDELRRIKSFLSEQRRFLKKKGISVLDPIPLGVMIETPSAVMEMDLLAREADFFSVGTNDLIQYLLAVDRSNELVSYLYNPFHPSVIRTLKRIVDTAQEYGKEVTLCGEIAADPLLIQLLLSLGFRSLSMNPASIPKIKRLIRMSTLEKSRGLLRRVLSSRSYHENKRMIHRHMSEQFPEYFQ